MSTETSPNADADRLRTRMRQMDAASLALASADAQLQFLTEFLTNSLDKKPEAFGTLPFLAFENLVWSISDRVDAARAALAGRPHAHMAAIGSALVDIVNTTDAGAQA